LGTDIWHEPSTKAWLLHKTLSLSLSFTLASGVAFAISPLEAGVKGQPVIRERETPGSTRALSYTTMKTAKSHELLDCPPILEFDIPEEFFASCFDQDRKITEIYVGDYPNYQIVRYDVDSALGFSMTPLPVQYGLVWLAVDLDCDGLIELVVQRGDGSNGFLDIISAPGWTLRQHFVFPGMNVVMKPVAVNIDADPYLEIYVTPHSVGGSARAVIIKYNPGLDTFEVLADIEAPYLTRGHPAVGDFDNDGRVEFISSNSDQYGLFEWQDTALVFIDQVGSDGVVNILDVVSVVEVVFRGESPDPDPGPLCPRERTDVDCSGSTDMLDVVRIVEAALRGGDPLNESCDPCAPQ